MRIGIEVRALHHSYRGSGQWRYAYNVLYHIAQQDRDHEYFLFAPYAQEELDLPQLPSTFHYTYRILPLPHKSGRRWLWEQALLPLFLRINRLEVCHFLLQMAPFWGPGKIVVTGHDAMQEIFPEYAHIRESHSYRFHKCALRKADRILAISQSTRDDLVRLYRIDPDRITVVPHAADPAFRPLPPTAEIMEVVWRKCHLAPPFVLSVLSYEPRKNTLGVIKAFARFLEKTRAPHKLMLFGDRGWGLTSDTINQALVEAHVRERVILIGRVPDDELVGLYNLAEFFVFPSLYEGFGLPVLEALACGAPVIVANASSMPEIVGDAGLLIDVTNVEQLAEAMRTFAVDDGLRQRMREKGLARAESFSWEETARRTLEVYHNLGTA